MAKNRIEESLRCPKCGSADVRRMAREGLLAWIHNRFGRAPFLCRSCHHRFFRNRDASL